MKCIKCGREINKSYAAAGFDGNYCKSCATELGYTPEQLEAEVSKGFSEACERLRKAGEELAITLSDSISKVLNGIPLEKQEEEKPKIDKCEDCIYRGEYQDMGATTPICRKGCDLVDAVKMRNGQASCKLKVTWQEINEYAKRRGADNG